MSENKNANRFLAEQPVGKLMLKYAVPSIVSMLISALYNMVDQVYIGMGLGPIANGATNVVYPITVIALAFALLIGNGCAAFFSISQGKKEFEVSKKAVGNAVVLTVGMGILLTVLYALLKEPILHAFGATVNNIGYAREYYTYLLIGVPFFMIDSALNSVVRADGSPKYAMTATCIGCVLNIILDPIAIFVLDWGMKGAALATITGQIVAGTMALIYLTRTKSFKLDKNSFKLSPAVMKRMLPLGLSSFITQSSIVLVMATVNNTLTKYGAMSQYGEDIPLAVLGIVMKINSIVIAFAVGLCIGIQPIIGYNYGAGKYRRVRNIFKKMLITEALIGTVSLLMFQLFPSQLIGMFGSADLLEDANMAMLYNEFAVKTMRIYLCGTVLFCMQRGCSLFLQALGKPMLSASMTMLRELVLHIPLTLILSRIMGLDGLLLTSPISDVISFTVAMISALYVVSKLKPEPDSI